MKRLLFLLLSCLLLIGCASEFAVLDPEAYRADATPPPPVEEANPFPAPDAPLWDEPADAGDEPAAPIASRSPVRTDAPSDKPTAEPTATEPTATEPEAEPRAEAPTLRERFAIPETVTVSERIDLLTVTGEPEILVPEVTALPAGTARAADFDQQTVDRVFAACMNGRSAIAPCDLPYTQEETDAMLAVIDAYGAAARYKRERYAAEDAARELKRRAPAERTRETALPVLAQYPVSYEKYNGPRGTYEAAQCFTAPDTAWGAGFYVKNNPVFAPDPDAAPYASCYGAQLLFLDPIRPTLDFLTASAATVIKDVTKEAQVRGLMPEASAMQTDPFGAVRQTKAFLERAGLTDFSVTRVTLHKMQRSDAQWYSVLCSRTVYGVPFVSPYGREDAADSAYEPGENAASSASWAAERLILLIADNGIRRVQWDRPIRVEAAPYTPALIPIDDVLALLREVLRERFAASTVSRTVAVERIALRMYVRDDPATVNEGVLVPVWCVTFRQKPSARETEPIAPTTLLLHAETGEILTLAYLNTDYFRLSGAAPAPLS